MDHLSVASCKAIPERWWPSGREAQNLPFRDENQLAKHTKSMINHIL